MTAIDLDWERKRRSENNTELSPVDLLRLALEDLERGDYPRASKCLIAIVESDDNPNDVTINHYYRSGVSRSDEIALLSIWHYSRMRNWHRE